MNIPPRIAKLLPVLLAIFVVGFVLIIVYFRSQNSTADDVSTGDEFATIQYLPLGDSYTIGTSVDAGDNWPSQLTAKLQQSNVPIEIIANPAVNGYTTADLILNELPLLEQNRVDFVTIQIGVNDWIQKVSISDFRANLVNIVDRVQSQITNKQNVVLITIPDFSVTDAGSQYGGKITITKGITEFNNVIKQVAKDRDLSVIDVFLTSQRMGIDPTLVATDGLHPSAKEYARWVDQIFPVTLNLLKR